MFCIGLTAILLIFFCLISLIQTYRFRWLIGGIWCGWLLGEVYDSFLHKDINGLVVVILSSMVAISIIPLFSVKIWNGQKQKKFSVLAGAIFLIITLEIGYCFFQAPIFEGISKSIWNYRPGSGMLVLFLAVVKIWILVMFFAALAFLMTNLFFASVDRFFSKRIKMTLLRCHTFKIGKIHIIYILEGIQNGVTYHFRMTPKAYASLKNQALITLTFSKGCFGGLYCLKIPKVDNEENDSKTTPLRKRSMYQNKFST